MSELKRDENSSDPYDVPRRQIQTRSTARAISRAIDNLWYDTTMLYYKFTHPARIILDGRHPLRTTWQLLWPYPEIFPLPEPLSVDYIMLNPLIIYDRIPIADLRLVPRWARRDTPMRSLYRLYEIITADDDNELMKESNYFFHDQPTWRLADLEDPKDTDPRRYAILASLVDAMVLAFNRKIQLGLRRGITNNSPWLIYKYRDDPNPPLETGPQWTNAVGSLPESLCLVRGATRTLKSENPAHSGENDRRPTHELGPFAKRNIYADFVQLFNV